MKYTLILFGLLLSVFVSAQNTVTLSPETDFKTIKDGKITVVMTAENPLSAEETANLNQWIENNAANIKLEVSGNTYTAILNFEMNDKYVYLKMWARMGVSFVKINENGTQVKLLCEEALSRFGF